MPNPRSSTKYLETGLINQENWKPWASVVCSTIHINQQLSSHDNSVSQVCFVNWINVWLLVVTVVKYL